MAQKEDLLLLFDRPIEPSFTKRGQDFDSVFTIPNNFLTDRYKPIGSDIQKRFGDDAGRSIRVKNITPPNLGEASALDRREKFSLWIPRHRKCAARLIDIFMGVRTVEDLLATALYAKDRCNPYMFQYCYSVALIHRPDTKNLDLPNLAETQPEKFVDSMVYRNIREEAQAVEQANRVPIEIPRDYTASDLDPEHRLWYFREDVGINLHHWHWHLVYPFEASNRALVAKDRRGELFYYMHEQIIARYNFERFCNGLPRVVRYNNFRVPIKEGYFPKMDSLVSSRAWPPRAENMIIQDLNRELDQVRIDVADLERWRDRVFEAIHQRAAVNPTGQRIPLVADGSTDSGIDILGNMLESSVLSPNQQLYGDMHNFGHVFISYIHDPNHKHLESFGVMGDSTTAMRDPIFYRWHAFIDDVFQEYKEQLDPYTQQQLTFNGVRVDDIQVQPQNGQMNTLETFFEQSDMNISRGLDFLPHGPIFVRFTHLQHIPFTYTIQITNTGNATRLGMVRIFLAPKNDERGIGMLMRDQRLMMIELDKFIVQLSPGTNVIRHASTESTVTIPYDRTFRSLNQATPQAGTEAASAFNFCGCGWPHHMLIPRGNSQGLPSELFVMVSDYEQDKVDQDLVGTCNDAASYCGVRDRLYPDKRPMGYPFDRIPRVGGESLSTFLTPNMKTKEVRIIHKDQVRPRPRN